MFELLVIIFLFGIIFVLAIIDIVSSRIQHKKFIKKVSKR